MFEWRKCNGRILGYDPLNGKTLRERLAELPDYVPINKTWALELLDFELACSPAHPYTSEDDMRHIKNLFPREIIQTYVVINYIAGVLREEIDFAEVDALFADYGFDLKQYEVIIDRNRMVGK